MVNKIWGFFLVVGILYALITGNGNHINNEVIGSTKTTFDLIVQIIPMMALWVGIMQIAQESGLLKRLAKLIEPVLTILFPEIPKGHEAFGFIATNMIANMFGLGNAATPFGLKAMKSMQTLNQTKEIATRSMITFLVINTSSITLIPTTVISLRMAFKSTNPTSIVLVSIITSLIASILGLLVDRLLATIYMRKTS